MGRKGNMWIYSKQSESVSDRVNNREISCAGEKRHISSFKRLAGNIKSKSHKGRNGEKLAAGGWRKDGLVEMRMLIIKTLAENATVEAQKGVQLWATVPIMRAHIQHIVLGCCFSFGVNAMIYIDSHD